MPNPIPRNRSARPQPRQPGRHRASPDLPFRRPRENIRQPPPTRSSTDVVVGVLVCATAAIVILIILQSLPSGTSAGSTAAPPMSGHADAVAAGGDDPGPVGGQLATRPGTLAGLDRGPAPEGGARDGLAEVHRSVGFAVAEGQPGPAVPQPGPAVPLVRPDEPANAADPGPRADPPPVDQVQPRAVQSGKPGHTEPVRPREPRAPLRQPRGYPGPEPAQLRERLGSLAHQLAQLPLDRGGDADLGPPPHPQQVRPDRSAPKVVVRPPVDKAVPSRQGRQMQSGTSGPKHVNRPSGSQGASSPAGPSR